MIKTISIREYDRLYIRSERDLSHNTISSADAAYLQNVVIDSSPVFSFGNRCLIAQQYVGVIELPDFTIEILPKIYGEVDTDKLRDVLIRMLIVAHQINSIRQFKASVEIRDNSLLEVIVQSFLHELQIYVDSGLQHEYRKLTQNSKKLKGQIIFSQQLRHNVLAPTRFFCRFSKYIVDYDLNRFFKTCLMEMAKVSHDIRNRRMLEDLLPVFDSISYEEPEVAADREIIFNSLNIRAKPAYLYGQMFLKNLHATMNSGSAKVYTMLFNMDQLYELFIYRVAVMAFGGRITYQKMGNFLVERKSDGKKLVSLRPDLTYRKDDHVVWIIDTKWKLPGRFAKESDVYQMNAYSSSIPAVEKVILLYPRIAKSEHLVGSYSLLSSREEPRTLEIKLVDLMECLSWSDFLRSFKRLINEE